MAPTIVIACRPAHHRRAVYGGPTWSRDVSSWERLDPTEAADQDKLSAIVRAAIRNRLHRRASWSA
jgi:hypothetical protein